MLYAFGFIGLFTIGGLTGLFLATLGMDIHMHDTYFIIAHFHYVMVGGAIFGYLGGMHYWWPKITGRMYPEGWAKFACLNIFVGFNLTFFPQFVVGYLGMPRRYAMYAPEFQVYNVLSTAGATILGIGTFLVTEIMFFGGLFMAYLVYRHQSPQGFQEASHHLDVFWGTLNTALLIISSLTMALAVRAAQTSQKPKTQVMWLVSTMIL